MENQHLDCMISETPDDEFGDEDGDGAEPPRSRRPSQVQRIVRRLFELSMDSEEGGFLGSEAELLDRLGVSRPTLRQAAKIVQSDQLLEIRRGAGGGFFAARPDAKHVVQRPAFYLRMQGATLQQMREASAAILPEVTAGAALCGNGTLIDALEALKDELTAMGDPTPSTRQIIDLERRLSRLVAEMTSNPFLSLFMDILFEFGLLERNLRFYDGHSNRRRDWFDLQLGLCDALIAGDPEQARDISRRRSKLIEQWIADDLPPSVRIVRRTKRRLD
jgi:GntR family transcriptional regulator, transcriptional repressor for pyruvate dehydrogenase complex